MPVPGAIRDPFVSQEEYDALAPLSTSPDQSVADVLMDGGVTGSLVDIISRNVERNWRNAERALGITPPSPMLSARDAETRYGIKGHLTFDHDVSEEEAQWKAHNKREELFRRSILERSELGPLTSMAYGMLGVAADPLEFGASLFPVAGEEFLAARLGLAGLQASRVGYMASFGFRNAYQGLVSSSVEAAFKYGVGQYEGREYRADEAFADVLSGTALGTAVGAGVGGIFPGRITPRTVHRGLEPGEASSLARVIEKVGERTAQGVVSRDGARGTMQTIEGTARRMARSLGEPFDKALWMGEDKAAAAYSQKLGDEYVRQLLARYNGDAFLATTAYHAGEGRDGVDGWIKRFGDPSKGEISYAAWIEKVRTEGHSPITAAYAKRVMAAYDGPGRVTAEEMAAAPAPEGPRIDPEAAAQRPTRIPAAIAQMDPEAQQAASVIAFDHMANDRPVDIAPVIEAENAVGGRPRPNLDDAEGNGWSFPAREGAAGVAVTVRGKKVPIKFALVEAADLNTSHTDELVHNPLYPDELQPRDRERAGSQARLLRMEREFVPERLIGDVGAESGAPIVAPDGTVESGNGRMIVLRRNAVRASELYDRYRAALEAAGYDTAGMTHPVLVRVRDEKMTGAQRVKLTREMNADTTEGLSVVEQARADAQALTDDDLALFAGGEVGAAANRPFHRRFVDKLAPGAENQLVDQKTLGLTRDGERRIQAALLHRAYGDDDLVYAVFETTDENIVALGKAMVQAAPDWAKMRGAVARGDIAPWADQTDSLKAAVNLVRNARTNGAQLAHLVDEGRNSLDIFSGKTAISQETETWLHLMYRDGEFKRPRSAKAVQEGLQAYAREAMETSPGPDLLGASHELTAHAILESVIRRARGEEGPPPPDPLGGGKARDPKEGPLRPYGEDVSPSGEPGAGRPGDGGARPAGGGGPGEGGGPGRVEPAPPAAQAAPAAGEVAAPFQNKPKPLDPRDERAGYVRDLGDHTQRLYREMNGEDFESTFLPHSGSGRDVGDVHMADTPDLALGQGDNKGVLVEFDAAGLKGKRNLGKPGLRFIAEQGGGGEYIAKLNQQGEYQSRVRAFRLADDMKMGRGRERLARTLKRLRERGWTVHQGGGFTEYRRPDLTPAEAQAAAPAAPAEAAPVAAPAEAAPVEAAPAAGDLAGDPRFQQLLEITQAQNRDEDYRTGKRIGGTMEGARLRNELLREAKALRDQLGLKGPEGEMWWALSPEEDAALAAARGEPQGGLFEAPAAPAPRPGSADARAQAALARVEADEEIDALVRDIEQLRLYNEADEAAPVEPAAPLAPAEPAPAAAPEALAPAEPLAAEPLAAEPVAAAPEPVAAPEPEPVVIPPALPSADPEVRTAIHEQLTPDDHAALAGEYGRETFDDAAQARFADDFVSVINGVGEKVSAAVRAIIERIRAAVLSVALVFNPGAMVHNVPHAEVRQIVTTHEVRADVPQALQAKGSQLAQQVYSVVAPTAMKRDKGFIIADKPGGRIYAFGKDGELIAEGPALYGAARGDVIRGDSLTSGNAADKITPAGEFSLRLADNPDYTGGQVLRFQQRDGTEDGVAIHAVYTGDAAEGRPGRLASQTTEDNKVSFGCINTANDFFLGRIQPHGEEFDGGMVFVLPDETAKTGEMFKPETVTETTQETVAPASAPAAPDKPPQRDLALAEDRPTPHEALAHAVQAAVFCLTQGAT